MKALTFRLHLLEPVLVAQAESGEEDSAIGMPFIPGSALRGALIGRYLEKYPSDDLAGEGRARRLFFDGTTCFLNAYPWRQGSRMLPKPMSWFTEKKNAAADEGLVCDWAVAFEELEQPKPPKGGDFCQIVGRDVALYAPPRQLNVHIALIDPNRRDDRNKIYRYDALARGEYLAGVILSKDQDDLDTIQELLDWGDLQIGSARTAGYGRVAIKEVVPVNDWEEYEPGVGSDESIIVTLLSDAILRDKNGQVNGDLNQALATLLNVSDLKPKQVYRRLRLVAGFNCKWSLPLPQTWALQAGSVYVYPADAFDPQSLRQAVVSGIGERRAEGFGRLAVNWHTQPNLQRQPPAEEHFWSVPALSKESESLALQMAQRRLRHLLDRGLAGMINGIPLRDKGLPQNAQLSRVRNAAQAALIQTDLAPIKTHLDSLKAAKEQFEKARVDNMSLLRWIHNQVEDPDIQSLLLSDQALPKVAGQEAVLDQALQVRYTARLIDGVMKKAIKLNKKEVTVQGGDAFGRRDGAGRPQLAASQASVR